MCSHAAELPNPADWGSKAIYRGLNVLPILVGGAPSLKLKTI